MHVIRAHHAIHYPDLKGFARLSHQLSYPFRHLPVQYLVPVLRYPYKMVLNLKNCMAAVSVIHAALPFVRLIILGAKADRLKPVI
jgi:hypothetical protein